jgi:hypothetical protein
MSYWIPVLGRVGTVIIAISSALLLVSLIPPSTIGRLGWEMPVRPEEVVTAYSRTLTPQQELQLKVTVEGNINVYLLDVGRESLAEVTNETGLYHLGSVVHGPLFANATELQQFLEEHPDLIRLEYSLEDELFESHFSPTRVMNVTIVFYNPSLADTLFDFEVVLQNVVAPEEKTLNVALWVIPIGLVLTIPWFTNMWKQRKRKRTRNNGAGYITTNGNST